MATYGIYKVGQIGGKIIVVGPDPDADGLAVMTTADYDAGFGGHWVGKPDYDNYDVTSGDGIVVLHPSSIEFDDPRVQSLLQ